MSPHNNHSLHTSLCKADSDPAAGCDVLSTSLAEDWMKSVRIVAGAQKTPVK